MIVPVMGEYVKAHQAEHPLDLIKIPCQFQGKFHQHIIIQIWNAVAGFQQGAHRSHMHAPLLSSGDNAVKTLYAKIPAADLGGKKPGLRHFDAAFPRAKRIAVFFFSYIFSIHGSWKFDDPFLSVNRR